MVTPAPLHAVVMDDALELLPLYEEVLREEGFRVTLLDDVSADVRDIIRLDPDLIVLDLLIAHENRGLPFLRSLRDDPDGVEVPVIVCSAANEVLHEVEDEIHRLNAALVNKPFDIEQLLDQARVSVARSSRLHSGIPHPPLQSLTEFGSESFEGIGK